MTVCRSKHCMRQFCLNSLQLPLCIPIWLLPPDAAFSLQQSCAGKLLTHTSKCPPSAASNSGVSPSGPGLLTGAPAATSMLTMSACPSQDATCSGLSPSALARVALALLSRRILTQSAWPPDLQARTPSSPSASRHFETQSSPRLAWDLTVGFGKAFAACKCLCQEQHLAG